MANKELETLFASQHFDLKPWVGRGKIPKHYKRLTCSEAEAMRLAKIGFVEIAKYYGDSLYFTQSLIAGALLSGDYDIVTVVSPSSYGKSFLFGRIGNIMAYKGEPTYVVAATQDGTKMIMGHVASSIQTIAPEVQNALLNKKSQLERLTTSVSKQKIAFANGGFIEPITTGDTYDENISQNKVVGKPGNYLIDEAALISEQSFAELGRAEFARVDGRNYIRAMISNPHQPGFFYSELTKPDEELGKREIIIWMDALTAVEEERLTKEKVFYGTFAKHRSTLRRYLLCVLDDDGTGMFTPPSVIEEAPYDGEDTQYFIGVDAAYKGKDDIKVAVTGMGGGHVWTEKIITIQKKNWIDGKTPKDTRETKLVCIYNQYISVSTACLGDIILCTKLIHATNIFIDVTFQSVIQNILDIINVRGTYLITIL